MESTGGLNGGKVIVTTATKVKVLEKLKDFWGMKTMLLQARRNPLMNQDPKFLRASVQYVMDNSTVRKQKFWTHLSEEDKVKASQYFALQEFTESKYTRILSTKDHGALYIVLSGTAEVREDAGKDPKIYGPGEVFGSIELFDLAAKDIDALQAYFNQQANDKTSTEKTKLINAQLSKGTYIRIGLEDFYNFLRQPKPVDETALKDEAEQIAEMPWDELTEDDKFYIRVYKRTRDLINKNLFSFLDSYRLIPKNSRTPAYRFFNQGDFGREILLNPMEATNVYIIIDGGIRIDIEAKRDDHKSHTLSCKRKGKKPMVIKTRTMPILLLESGSLLYLNKMSFTVGMSEDTIEDFLDAANEEKPASPSMNRRSANTELIVNADAVRKSVMPFAQRKDSISSQASSTTDNSGQIESPIINRQRKRNGNKNIKSNPEESPLYKIKFVFETSTTYLKIPFSYFERILDEDNKLIMKSIAHAIRDQLNRANDRVHKRIKGLESWIMGNLTANPPVPKKLATIAEVPPIESSALSTAASPDATGMALMAGSFTLSGFTAKDMDSTVGSLTMETSTVQSQAINNVADANLSPTKKDRKDSMQQSVLQKMISELKSQSVKIPSAKSSFFVTQESSGNLEKGGETKLKKKPSKKKSKLEKSISEAAALSAKANDNNVVDSDVINSGADSTS